MVEVLAPAGSYESLIAAVNAGADAIYVGGTKFGARAYASNPEEDLLIDGLNYAHHFGVKIYMTVNTLLKNKEIDELCDYIKPYYEAGLDAVIVQDFGVFEVIHKHFPDLDIHASTQMTVTGPLLANMLKKMGASRIVPARELSLEEIQNIDKSCDIEIECFVHGALCYAYSGQCLMSSLIGGRSGNRGRCAQPCRLAYELFDDNTKLNKPEEQNLLSCKDLCSLDILPKIIEAGIDSLKIEGRMKSPRYTAGVVSVWRKYVDMYYKNGSKAYKVEPSDRRLLLDLFDRGGQTDGYYTEHNGKDMMAFEKKPDFRSGNEELFKYIDETYINTTKKISIDGYCEILAGKPMKLSVKIVSQGSLSDDKYTIVVYGDIPDTAIKAEATEASILKQLNKTGSSFFDWNQLELDIDGGLFIPVQKLNELRRSALDKLDATILGKYHRICTGNLESPKIAIDKYNKIKKSRLSVTVETKEQLEAVSYVEGISEIILESDAVSPKEFKYVVERAHNNDKLIYLYMPHIFRTQAKLYFDKAREYITEAGFDGYVIRTAEEISYLIEMFKGSKPYMIFDYCMYGMNHEAENVLMSMGADRLTVPVELNEHELLDLGCTGKDMIVYGKMPMMVSAQCLKKNTIGCDKKQLILTLKDRYSKEMSVKNHCAFCYNTILNAQTLSLIGMKKSIHKLSPRTLRLWFTTESGIDTKYIVDNYVKTFIDGESCVEPVSDYTRGHMKRGVE